MALCKVALLLAVMAGVTVAADLKKEAQKLVDKAMFDGSANELAPGKPPYSFCGGRMAKGKFIVESVKVAPGAGGDLYTMKVTVHQDADFNHDEVNIAGKPLQLLKKGNKLTIKDNPCSHN